SPTNLGLSRKVRSHGAARSSGATLVIRRPRSACGWGSAPVRAAIPPTVRADAVKNTGPLMPPGSPPTRRTPAGPGSTTEAEQLRVVPRLLGQRVGQIEAQRTERRIPDQAHADGRADHRVVAERQRTNPRHDDVRTGGQKLARLGERGRTLVVQELAGIRIS